MVKFPETAWSEWSVAAAAVEAENELRRKIAHDTAVENAKEKLWVSHDSRLRFQQELDSEQTPVLEMTTLAAYQGNPLSAPVDMIDGVLKQDGLTILLGPSGSGKSTVGLQMVHSLMTGSPWLGQPATAISGGVGVLSYDMDASMVMDWMDGFPGIDPTKVSVVNAYRRGNPLGVPDMRKAIAEAWKRMDVEVVIVDSFSASFFGQDQNDAAATMHHYRDLKLFAMTEVGAKALIVITHSTESSPHKARGSTVHQDVADSIVSVTSDPKTQQRTVQMVKYRAARGQAQMNPVIVTAPDAVTHLVALDLGAMTLEDMKIPSTVASTQFPDLPDPQVTPDMTAPPESETTDESS